MVLLNLDKKEAKQNINRLLKNKINYRKFEKKKRYAIMKKRCKEETQSEMLNRN